MEGFLLGGTFDNNVLGFLVVVDERDLVARGLSLIELIYEGDSLAIDLDVLAPADGRD